MFLDQRSRPVTGDADEDMTPMFAVKANSRSSKSCIISSKTLLLTRQVQSCLETLAERGRENSLAAVLDLLHPSSCRGIVAVV